MRISCASTSASGDWRWPENRAAWTPAAGSTAKSAKTATRNPSATSITFNEDTADVDALESTLARLSEMVGRRLREHQLLRPHRAAQAALFRFLHHHARPFARSRHPARHRNLPRGPRACSAQNRKAKATIRLLGVHASGLEAGEGQLNLLAEEKTNRWRKALTAVDQIRDKFGEDSVSLASGTEGPFPRASARESGGITWQDPARRLIRKRRQQALNY